MALGEEHTSATSSRSSTRIQHGAATRYVANKQDCKDAEQKQCRPQVSRTKIEPGVNDVNGDATCKDCPAVSVGPVPAKESSKTKGKHVRQGPIPAAGIGSKKSGEPRHDITNNLKS